jgi:hypothetical protein
MLLRLFHQYFHCRPTKDLLHRILVAFCSLIPTSPKIGCGFMGEHLLLLVKKIHMAAEKLGISDLIARILDVGLMPHSIPSASASAILPSILYRENFAILYTRTFLFPFKSFRRRIELLKVITMIIPEPKALCVMACF